MESVSVIERIIIKRNKKFDSLILAEIRKIATENGIDTIVNLNDKAIVSALEKQIPKKPIKKNPICYNKTKMGEEFYFYDYYCPLCYAKVNNEKHHCPCGQRLDWSETDER